MNIHAILKALLVVVSSILITHPAFSQSESELWDKEIEQIAEQYRQGKISHTVSLRKTLEATKIYHPSDKITQAFFESLIDYSEQQDNKLISQKRYEELLAALAEKYYQTSIKMNNTRERAQKQVEQMMPLTTK